jgi:uncharacterized protein YndB with AHSA1/START domain
MSKPSAQHATFVIEREFAATPAQVFGAWSDPKAKARWFGGPSDKWTVIVREFDFRVGGRERLSGKWAEGAAPKAGFSVSAFDAHYFDIVPEKRIVYGYDMHLDERLISVSLATIEFQAAQHGTQMILTEQGAFLDGFDDAGSREQGTRELMNRLEASLRQSAH